MAVPPNTCLPAILYHLDPKFRVFKESYTLTGLRDILKINATMVTTKIYLKIEMNNIHKISIRYSSESERVGLLS